jgi:hypothetical protein
LTDRDGPLPGSFRAETPRLSWLDQQDGEQQMFGDGRDGKRYERTPLLQRRHSHGNDDAGRRGERSGVRQNKRWVRCRGLTAAGRRGAAVVGLRLADHMPRTRTARLRFVHRTSRAVRAARHSRFGSRLPSGADRHVPDAQRQDRCHCGEPSGQRQHLRRMRDDGGSVKSPRSWSRLYSAYQNWPMRQSATVNDRPPRLCRTGGGVPRIPGVLHSKSS